MNNKLRTESKNYFEKDFFKPMNSAVFGKNNAKCKKAQRLVTTEKRRNQLASEPDYHKQNIFQAI